MNEDLDRKIYPLRSRRQTADFLSMRARWLATIAMAWTLAACEPASITTAESAIAAANAEWKRLNPNSEIEDAEVWQHEFSATLSDGIWLVRQNLDSHDEDRGLQIYLDAYNGRIIHSSMVK